MRHAGETQWGVLMNHSRQSGQRRELNGHRTHTPSHGLWARNGRRLTTDDMPDDLDFEAHLERFRAATKQVLRAGSLEPDERAAVEELIATLRVLLDEPGEPG
jgi:hypothetical protein